jgi:hypothetical protein
MYKGQDNSMEAPGEFDPDRLVQTLKDVTRNMSRSITFGGMDYVAPWLGSGRTVEEEQAETAAAEKRLDPSVRIGTGVAADMMLPIAPVAGALAKVGKPVKEALPILKKGGWKQQVGKEAEILSTADKAKRIRAVKKGKISKDAATREAFSELPDTTKYKLTPAELEKLNKIIFGGPVRNTADAVARNAPKFPGPVALAASAGAGEYGGFGGVKAAAILGTLGLLSKGVKAGSQSVANILARRDIQEMLKTVKKGGQ